MYSLLLYGLFSRCRSPRINCHLGPADHSFCRFGDCRFGRILCLPPSNAVPANAPLKIAPIAPVAPPNAGAAMSSPFPSTMNSAISSAIRRLTPQESTDWQIGALPPGSTGLSEPSAGLRPCCCRNRHHHCHLQIRLPCGWPILYLLWARRCGDRPMRARPGSEWPPMTE